MTTTFVVDAVEQAIFADSRAGRELTGLVTHLGHGVQHLALAYSEHLDAAGTKPSTEAIRSSYDNALAETINGLYKTGLSKPRRPWKGQEDLEIATAEWVYWYNNPPPPRTLRRPDAGRSRKRSLRSPSDPSTPGVSN